MTGQERVDALRRFGYNDEESRFLCLVALHSGYFLRRQFSVFAAKKRGRRDTTLADRVLARGQARLTAYRHNRLVYHLFAKPLYEALGEPDNRNRRARPPFTIKNKLMGLDFVLAHPEHDYLATEREKLAYFCDTRGIARDRLPTKRYCSPRTEEVTARYFVEKYPLFLSAAPGADARVVHFCFVDEGVKSTGGFGTFLRHYQPLFTALGDFRVVYVTAQERLRRQAERVFMQECGLVLERRAAGRELLDPDMQQLLDYFEVRQKYDTRSFAGLTPERIAQYREERQKYTGERYESLYRHWQKGGEGPLREALSGPSPPHLPHERSLIFHRLEHDYELFGTLTAAR